MKSFSYPLFFLLFYNIAIGCFAQKYNFKSYQVVDGLGASTINHIYQDKYGYIWFATQGGGASRFDGRQFKNFTRAQGLINNDVTYITGDNNGNVWIATAAGVSKYDGKGFTNYNRQNGLSSSVVYAIYCDNNANVYFATQDSGIRVLRRGRFYALSDTGTLPSNESYCVVGDKQGNCWAGLSGGIVKYKNNNITDLSEHSLIKNKTFFCAHADKHGNVWFGSTTGDLLVIDKHDSIKKIPLPYTCTDGFIGGITEDKQGNLWLAINHGLLKYNGREFKLFGEEDGLTISWVQTVQCDYEGKIWAGTLGGGVNVLNSEAFLHFTEKEGLNSQNITSIVYQPNDGVYLIGTTEGLFEMAPGRKPAVKKWSIAGLPNRFSISSLLIDRKQKLWITAQEGVFVLTGNKAGYSVEKKMSSINGHAITSPVKVIQDTAGNYWIATYGSGVICIGNKSTTVYNTKNKFYSDKILAMHEDKKGCIWFGTQDTGVVTYNNGKFEHIKITDNSIWSIAEGKNGTIYFGTGESGVVAYNKGIVNQYNSSTGLHSGNQQALFWDSTAQALWLGSEKGLQQLTLSAAGTIKEIRTYSQTDGFSPSAINQNGISVFNHALWLCTINGLWQFNPLLDLPAVVAPKIQLNDIRIFYQQANLAEFSKNKVLANGLPVNASFPHNKNHLTFDIQGLTRDDVYYTCMLQGQDSGWCIPTRNNEITYTNILPGDYVFMAKAINKRGMASNEIINFAFTVTPPWWNNWWFRAIALTVFMCGSYLFIKYREKTLIASNNKLEGTVKQRTQEIVEQKHLVEQALGEKEKLLQDKEILLKEIHHRVKNNLQTISSMLMLQASSLADPEAKKAIAESQNRVRSIALLHQKLYQNDGLEKIELNDFVHGLLLQIQSVYEQQNKKIQIDIDIPEVHLLLDTALPLGLILNELFTNSFKYAFAKIPEGRIAISAVTNTANKIESITYCDNGPGFPITFISEKTTTLGIKLIKLLSAQLDTELTYTNVNGSEFIFTFSEALN